MKTSMRNIIPAAVAGIIFVGIIVSVLPYPMAAKRLPLIVSGVAIFLSCIVIAQELLPKKEETSEIQTDTEGPKTKREDIPAKVLLVAAGWIMGIIVLLSLFGFIIGFSLYVFLYCKFHGGSWKESILLGFGVSAFVYFVFVVVLEFLLPKGLLIGFLLS